MPSPSSIAIRAAAGNSRKKAARPAIGASSRSCLNSKGTVCPQAGFGVAPPRLGRGYFDFSYRRFVLVGPCRAPTGSRTLFGWRLHPHPRLHRAIHSIGSSSAIPRSGQSIAFSNSESSVTPGGSGRPTGIDSRRASSGSFASGWISAARRSETASQSSRPASTLCARLRARHSQAQARRINFHPPAGRALRVGRPSIFAT